MCGIIGYVGDNEAFPIIIKGLKRLEYRGYDSAGISISYNNKKAKNYFSILENRKNEIKQVEQQLKK